MGDVCRTEVRQVPVHPGEVLGRIHGQLEAQLNDRPELAELLVVSPAAQWIRERGRASGGHQRCLQSQRPEMRIQFFGLHENKIKKKKGQRGSKSRRLKDET